MRGRLIESRIVHLALATAGGLLLLLALVQLPAGLLVQYTRPSLPWFPVENVAEGVRIVPVVTREGEPDPQFQASDIITRIDDLPLDSAHYDAMAMQELVADFGIGDTVRVHLLREDETIMRTVVLDRSINDVRGREISIVALVINNISPVFIILVGYIVLLRRPRRRESALFFGSLFCYAWYLLASVQVSMYMPWWTALGEVRTVSTEIAFMLFLPMLLHFLLVFPDEWFMRERRRLRLLLLYTPYVLLTVAGYVLINVMELPLSEEYSTIANFIYLISPVLGLLVLRASYLRARAPMTRGLLKVVSIGMAAFAFGFILLILINHLYLFYDILLPEALELRLLSLLLITLMLPLTFGYALLRYGFLDIQILFKRTTLYAILSVFVVLVFILLNTILQALFSSFTSADTLLVSIIVTGVIAIFLAIGKTRIQGLLDRTLFREEWERRARLQNFGRSLLNMLVREDLLRGLTETLPDILEVDVASVVALDEEGNARLLAGASLPDDIIPRIRQQEDLFTRLAEIEVVDVNSFADAQSMHGLNAMVGIAAQDGEYILLMLGRKRSGRKLSAEDLAELHSVAEYAMLGWKNATLSEELREKERFRHEVQIAQHIQAAMLPGATPEHDRFDIAAYSVPAREVGGDFFDFLHFSDGRIGLLVGDVSDKGISAAMVMASTISTLRYSAEYDDSPRRILEAANRRIFRDTSRSMFVAVCIAQLDADTMQMSFTNAGLPMPLLLRDGAAYQIAWSDPHGHLALGVQQDTRYHQDTLDLVSGDVLILYSDGLEEMIDTGEDDGGLSQLKRRVLEATGSNAAEMLHGIVNAVLPEDPRETIKDDMTIVLCRVR
ncbi:MAG: SpoIIE family protein phosphatase [Bacteroidota bacterium]|nr:SpoIIE family protein phosphatase [Bacteroidota bacterium]